MLKRLAFILAALLLLAAPAFAQGPTRVQQDPQMLHAATNVQHSHTSAATLTLTASGSQSIYITGLDIVNCAGSSAVTAAVPTFITTTNIQGAPQYTVGSGVTAGLCTSSSVPAFATPLKSQTPGTNVTFVLPTFATNQTVSLNVYFYLAP